MIQDEIQSIVSSLRPEDRDHIWNLPEEDLILPHRTFGLTLRSAFRANRYPYLFTHCDNEETPETRSSLGH